MLEDELMGVCDFRDDEDDYLDWVGRNPGGYVLNIERTHSAAQARVHHADCRTISGQSPARGPFVGKQYVKVCARHLPELEQWARDHVRKPIPWCGTCHPGGGVL